MFPSDAVFRSADDHVDLRAPCHTWASSRGHKSLATFIKTFNENSRSTFVMSSETSAGESEVILSNSAKPPEYLPIYTSFPSSSIYDCPNIILNNALCIAERKSINQYFSILYEFKP